MSDPQDPELPTCVNDNDPEGCAGPVEYRMPLSDTGKSFPRCDKHWASRLIAQSETDRRYPAQPPADFDPLYAGESWEEPE